MNTTPQPAENANHARRAAEIAIATAEELYRTFCKTYGGINVLGDIILEDCRKRIQLAREELNRDGGL